MRPPDLEKLVQTAANTARAHRDAVRLLLQGIEDCIEDSEHTSYFYNVFSELTAQDTLSEAIMLTIAAETFFDPITDLAMSVMTDKMNQESDPELSRKKYESIIDEVKDRVISTCPCRNCVKNRSRAVRQVNACLDKIQKRVARETERRKP